MVYFPQVKPDLKRITDRSIEDKIQNYNNAFVADEFNRYRFIRNMMVSTGLRYDMWAKDWSIVDQLLAENRTPGTYNFLQYYIRGLAGNFIMNWFDPKFVSREDNNPRILKALTALQKIYYANKEHCNYKASVISCIWNGLVGRGVEELIIDRNQDSRGIIRFESIRPDMITFDPESTEDRLSRTSQVAWKRFYLTPEEMIRYFPHAEPEVRERLDGMVAADENTDNIYDRTTVGSFTGDPFIWGQKYLCFEEYKIEWEKETVLIHADTGMPFPESGFELGSEEDFIAKVLWGQENGFVVTPESISEVRKWTPVLYVTTICRAYSLLLERRRDERQLNGKLPFYCWSFMEKYGQSIGVVDLLIDAQDDLNRRENQKTKIITQTPIGGKTWIHPDAFGNNDQARSDATSNFNDCAKPFILDEDAPVGAQLFGVMPGANINPSIFQEENLKIDYMNRIASLPLAMQGITERSNESGIHLGRKIIEGSVMQRIPMEGIIQHENDKAEDWLTMALELYTGPANYNRTFSTGDGAVSVTINEFMGTDEQGNPVLENDVSEIEVERTDVIVTQSKENDFLRQAKRETDAAILTAIQPTETNGAARAAFISDLILSADFDDDVQKEKASRAAELYYDLEMTNGETALLNATLAKEKATAALKQLEQAKMQREQQEAQPTVEGPANVGPAGQLPPTGPAELGEPVPVGATQPRPEVGAAAPSPGREEVELAR